MAKSKRRFYKSMTIPLAPIGGLMAGLAVPISQAVLGNYTGSGGAIDWLIYNYTGFRGNFSGGQPTFDPTGLKNGLLPLIAGVLIHKFVGGQPIGINRMLGQAGVPVIRI